MAHVTARVMLTAVVFFLVAMSSVTETDKANEKMIFDAVRKRFPEDQLVGEVRQGVCAEFFWNILFFQSSFHGGTTLMRFWNVLALAVYLFGNLNLSCLRGLWMLAHII